MRSSIAVPASLLTLSVVFFAWVLGVRLASAEAAQPRVLSPSELLSAGRSFEAAREYEQAIAAYREYLAARPADDTVRGALARVLSWQGHYEEAVALYEDILTRHPVDLEVRVALARVKSWQRKFPEARELYDQVLNEEPGNLEAKQGRADTLYWSGEYALALRAYEDIFAATPEPEIAQKIQAVRTELANAALLSSPRAVVGQETPTVSLPYRQYLKVGYSRFSYTRGIEDEQNWLVEAAQPIRALTLVGRIEVLDRFGADDTSLSGELYSPLWKEAWGYAGAAVGLDPQFTPRWTAGGELFQGLGVVHPTLSFLEPSFGYRHMSFQSTDINLLVPGITVYLPFNLWLTEKGYFVPENGSWSLSSTLTWRATERLQVFASGAFGTASERISSLQDFVRTDTNILQGGVTFPLTERFSVEVAGVYEDRQGQYIRRGGSFAFLFHW